MKNKSLLNQMVFALVLFFFSSTAYSINSQQTRRSHSLTFEKLDDARTYNGHVRNDYKWILMLGGSYVDAPLTVKDPSNTTQLEELVQNMYGVHLGAGYYFKPWLMAGFETAYNQFEDNNGDSYSGFTDPQLKARIRFYNSKRLAFAVSPFVNFGLDQGEFTISNSVLTSMNGVTISPLSDSGLGWGVNLIGEYLLNRVQLVANLTYQSSSKAIDIDSLGVVQADFSESVFTGVGAYIPVRRSWGINLEYLRQWTLPLFNNDQERNEFFLGAAGALTEGLHAFGGLGLGNVLDDSDGNDFRVSIGLKYIGFNKEKRNPLRALIATENQRVVMNEEVQAADTVDVEPEKISTSNSNAINCKNSYIFGDTNFAVIRFPNNVGRLSKGSYQLSQLGDHLLKRRGDIVEISLHGHTSGPASVIHNDILARERVDSVKGFLLDLGFSQTVIKSKSFGESKLLQIETQNDNLAEAVNRRVEIRVTLNEKYRSCK